MWKILRKLIAVTSRLIAREEFKKDLFSCNWCLEKHINYTLIFRFFKFLAKNITVIFTGYILHLDSFHFSDLPRSTDNVKKALLQFKIQGCLCSSTLGPRHLSSALAPWHLGSRLPYVGPRSQKYCKNKFMNKAYYLFKIILIQDKNIILIQDIQKAI